MQKMLLVDSEVSFVLSFIDFLFKRKKKSYILKKKINKFDLILKMKANIKYFAIYHITYSFQLYLYAMVKFQIIHSILTHNEILCNDIGTTKGKFMLLNYFHSVLSNSTTLCLILCKNFMIIKNAFVFLI